MPPSGPRGCRGGMPRRARRMMQARGATQRASEGPQDVARGPRGGPRGPQTALTGAQEGAPDGPRGCATAVAHLWVEWDGPQGESEGLPGGPKRPGPNRCPGWGPGGASQMCNGRCTFMVWVGGRPRGHWGPPWGPKRLKTCPGGGPGGAPSMCNGRRTSTS